MAKGRLFLFSLFLALLLLGGALCLSVDAVPADNLARPAARGSPLRAAALDTPLGLLPAAESAPQDRGPSQDDPVLLWWEPRLAGYWDLHLLPDGQGGAYVAWATGTGNVPNVAPPYEGRTYIQRYNSDGDRLWPRDPGLWGTNDLLLSDSGRREGLLALLDDGAGGAIVVWSVDDGFDGVYGDLRAQRLSPAGDPLWQAGGVPVVTAVPYLDWGEAASDGQGGVVVTWSRCDNPNTHRTCEVRAQYIRPGGTPAWAAAGVPLSFVLDNEELWICWAQSDHQGGTYVVWEEDRDGTTLARVQHVDGQGNVRWTGDAHAFPFCIDEGVQIDGARVMGLRYSYSFGPVDVYMFDLETGEAQWGPVTVEDSTGYPFAHLASDGAGGALVSWRVHEGPWVGYVQRIDAAGLLLWAQAARLEGVLLTVVAPDGQGGAYAAWTDQTSWPLPSHYDLGIQHVDGDGGALWPAPGVVVLEDPDEIHVQMPSDGQGGAFVAWTTGTYWQGHEQDNPWVLQRGFTDSLPLPDYALRTSSPSFLPGEVFTPGHSLLLYSVRGVAEPGPWGPADLYVVVNGDTGAPLRMENDGAGQNDRLHADLVAGDDHHSLWFTPTLASTYALALYAVPRGLPFNTDHPVDSLQLAPNPTPELAVLTDLRELFNEFNLTDRDSASQDRDLNGVRDYYDSLDRIRQYAASHQGVVLDVRQDAYAQDYAYTTGTATRQGMGRDLDRRLIASLKPLAATLEYVAVIGDDAVVPFYRYPDPTADVRDWDEARYVTETLGNDDHGVGTVQDSRAKQLMTDVPYSTWSAATPQAPRPDLALGRIFATRPLSLTEMIAGYEQPVRIGAQTGSAFVFSRANEYNVFRELDGDWQTSTRNNVITMLRSHGYITRTKQLTDRGQPRRLGWIDAQAGMKWRAANVGYVLNRAGGNRLTVLFSHAIHLYNETPSVNTSPPGLFWVKHLYALPPFPGAVLVNYGCHAGYSTGYDPRRTDTEQWGSSSAASKVTSPASLRGPWGIVGTTDWNWYYHALARAALERHLTYHATIPWGIFDGDGKAVRYHDWVHQAFLRTLLSAGGTTGYAHRAAQRGYSTAHKPGQFKAADVSALYGVELYGLPTQPVQRNITPIALNSGGGVSHPAAQAPALQSSTALTVSLAVPEFRVTSGEEGHTLFEVPHGGALTALGEGPYVPLLVRSVHFPQGTTGLAVSLVSSTTALFSGTVTLPPQRDGNRHRGSATFPFTGAAPYPAEPFWTTVYTEDGAVDLYISAMPLQWDPASGQVTLFHQIDFQVGYTLPSADVQIGAIVLNHGAPLTIDQAAIPITMAVTTADESPLTLRWQIEDAGGMPLRSGAGTFTPTLGANIVEWSTDSLGWLPGPRVLDVMLEDGAGTVLATKQHDLIAHGRSLSVSTDRGIYGLGHAQALIRAEVRDQTGAPVPGLATSFAQELDGAALSLVWHEDDVYTASLDLAAVPTGSHELHLALTGGPAAVAAFAVDRDPPTSTVSLWAHHGLSFTLSLGWWDEISSDGLLAVEHRVQDAASGAWLGDWTAWLTRSTAWDSEDGAPPDLWPTFGPTQPVPVDTLAYHYCFRTRAVDALGNQEAEHAQADLCVGPLRIYLPLVFKAHAP
jgi:hypothetical protein